MRRKLCKIQIKGMLYTVYKIDANDEYYGQMMPIEKQIEISNTKKEETIIHELMHAYFYECGAMKYCDDEDLQIILGRFGVELIRNYNKIVKAYNNLSKIVFKGIKSKS